MNYNDILFRHWLLFEYDTSDSYEFIKPHYLFLIKDSIHYKSLIKNDFKDYITLIETTNQLEHNLDSFKRLLLNFDIDILRNNKIKLEYNDKLNKYIVLDGCHRLSIMLFKNIELKKEYFDVKNR